MVSGFICGTNSFPKEEDNYERHTRSADSSPRKSRSSKSNYNKNPYSNRGLDKFSALLAEIEEKRQQIYSQVNNPHEISLVRFEYDGDHDFKPIIVKIKHRRSFDHLEKEQKFDFEKGMKFRKLHSSSSIEVKEEKKGEIIKEGNVKNNNNIKKIDICKKLRICQWKESQFYLVIVVILIFGFLVIFGRSFAIMCTSIGWYVIPTVTKNANSSTNSRVSTNKKKDYAIRRLSVKKGITNQGSKSFKTSEKR